MDRVARGLRLDATTVHAAVDQMTSAGLIARAAGPAEIELTPRGDALFQRVRDGIGRISERLYGDLPREDLALAHRVLAIVTERANAELAD